MARAYERRILQADATAWFGISNILATFAAAGTVLSSGLILTALRRDNRQLLLPLHWTGLALAALASISTLAMTRSKGGFVAAAIGVATLLTITALRRLAPKLLTPLSSLLPALTIAACLAAIALRGLIGDRLSELSLLFRSFYLAAATRIFAANPLGVGPSGFKDAYVLLKNPLSPEDVASPHSIFFDWLCCLGIFGLPWSALWFRWISRAARDTPTELPTEATPNSPTDERSLARLTFITLAIPALIGAALERAAATPEGLAVRFASIFLGTLIAVGLSRALSLRSVAAATLATACTLAAHAQIELTPSAPSACAWFLALCATLGPCPQPISATSASPHRLRIFAFRFSLFAFLPPAALLALQAPAVFRWQSSLTQAAAVVEPLPQIKARRDALAAGRPALPGDTPAKLYADLEGMLQFKPRSTPNLPAAIDADILEIRRQTLTLARPLLKKAFAAAPTHFETLRALSRLDLEIHAIATPPGSPFPANAGEQAAVEILAATSNRSTAWSWLAVIREAAALRSPSPAASTSALQAWSAASAAAPFEPSYAAKAAFAADAAGLPDQAATLATKALTLDANMRLDPLRQLPPADRERLTRLASPPQSPTPPPQ